MASNPFDDNDPAIRERIERRAYHLWQGDGEPHGRHDEYWERASELVHMEMAGNTGQLPNPATLPGADPNAPDVIEDARIQENLGEFPDRFADQGEKTATPRPRARKKAEALPLEPPKPAAKPAAVAEKAKLAKPAPAATPKAAEKAKPAATPKAAAEQAKPAKPTPAAKSKPTTKSKG